MFQASASLITKDPGLSLMDCGCWGIYRGNLPTEPNISKPAAVQAYCLPGLSSSLICIRCSSRECKSTLGFTQHICGVFPGISSRIILSTKRRNTMKYKTHYKQRLFIFRHFPIGLSIGKKKHVKNVCIKKFRLFILQVKKKVQHIHFLTQFFFRLVWVICLPIQIPFL